MTATVFDTNALIFAFANSPKLSAVAAEAITATGRDRLVSTASYYEVALKHAQRKLGVSASDIDRGVRASGLRVVPPSTRVMVRAAELDWDIRDPWDRIIAATAIELAEGRVVARDEAFRNLSSISVIW